MISLILSIIFILLFIFFCIYGGNHLLKNMVDHVLNSTENFENIKDAINDTINDTIINPIDDCSKIDILTDSTLNFQTATNIPLSPNRNYKNYVGTIYNNDDNKIINEELMVGNQCLRKGKLLYDGIWDPVIEKDKDTGYEYETWNLTNGNLTDGYYCSDKLLQLNKEIPANYIDRSATPPITDGKYYTYFNDPVDDKYDTEIACFPSVFNAGITEDLKPKY